VGGPRAKPLSRTLDVRGLTKSLRLEITYLGKQELFP
jgi:hypothetical protein